MIWICYEGLISMLNLFVCEFKKWITLAIKAADFSTKIRINFISMNITSLASLVLVLALSMGVVDAGRTQRRLNLLRRFHKTKMQIKEAKAVEHSPMDARMMPRSRNIEAKNVPISSVKNIGSLNLRTLQRDEKVTQLQAQIKTLFKQRKSSRNKLFYWNINPLKMYKIK